MFDPSPQRAAGAPGAGICHHGIVRNLRFLAKKTGHSLGNFVSSHVTRSLLKKRFSAGASLPEEEVLPVLVNLILRQEAHQL